MQVSKQQQRIRGIIARAQTLLANALEQMYDVFDGDAHTIVYIEGATTQVRNTLSHFDKDAIAYNRQRAADETAKAIEDAAAKKKEEDAVAAEVAEGGSASFDDKGKRIGKDGPPRQPPTPKPRPKHHAECTDSRCHEDCDVARAGEAELPEIKRDKLSDFGEGSDQ